MAFGVGEILSGVGSLISAGTGIYNSIQGNKLNREQFEYNKNLQNQIFQREDTAVQRRVKDLEAAGFSKWNAVGQSAGSGAVVGTNLEHKNVDMSGAIIGLNSLSEMMYNAKQQEANINLSSAQAGLLRSQILTEAQKRLNMIAESDLTKAQKNKIEQDTIEMINSINWHWNTLDRPRDYVPDQLSSLAETLVGRGAVRGLSSIPQLFKMLSGKK